MTHFDCLLKGCISEQCPVRQYCYLNSSCVAYWSSQIYSDYWYFQNKKCEDFNKILGHFKYMQTSEGRESNGKYGAMKYSEEDYKIQNELLTTYGKGV